MAVEYIWTFETKHNGVVEVSTKENNKGIAIVELALACSGRFDLGRDVLRKMGNKLMEKFLGMRAVESVGTKAVP